MKRFTVWIVFFAVIALLVWGVVAGSKKDKIVVGALSVPVSASDWSRGATSTAKVTLVEYSDLQCPACAAYEPIVKKLVTNYPNDLKLVYRHFPLITIHVNADYAAGAAEAAGNQGKFWEMHDLLFEKQLEWETSTDPKIFSDYAATLGLDVEKFAADIASSVTRKKINESYRSGIQSGVQGTPTFFLDGKMITSPHSEEEFNELIKNAIASSTVY